MSIETADVRASGAGVKAIVSHPQVLGTKLQSFARQYVILTPEPSLEPQHYNFNLPFLIMYFTDDFIMFYFPFIQLFLMYL